MVLNETVINFLQEKTQQLIFIINLMGGLMLMNIDLSSLIILLLNNKFFGKKLFKSKYIKKPASIA